MQKFPIELYLQMCPKLSGVMSVHYTTYICRIQLGVLYCIYKRLAKQTLKVSGLYIYIYIYTPICNVNLYMCSAHTYIHTYNICIYIYADICRPVTCAYMTAPPLTSYSTYQTYQPTFLPDRPYVHAHTYIHTCRHTFIRTYRQTHKQTYIHTYLHTYLHTYIQHTYLHPSSQPARRQTDMSRSIFTFTQ